MPAFARDPGTAAYYEQRAAEYDEWYESLGRFSARSRPGWDTEVDDLRRFVHALEPARTLDVACGSGFLTRHLRGYVVALDQSPSMVTLTQRRIPHGIAMRGDALDLPFADNSFDRVFTGHFYGHLPPSERATFLAEARRVARELIVVDTALRPDGAKEQQQERILNDGSRHHVFKRFLTAEQLADEIGGQPVLTGDWFVAAASSR